ncbi:TPA: restriction endonuclease subunit S [Neisseria subflava]|jgi:putative type I restriction modification DNA specificity domain protein
MATFDFSEKLPFGEMFLVRSSEIEGRIDPLYYQTIHNFIFAKQKKYTVSKMVDCIDMQRGRFGHRPRNDPKLYGGDYPFIQTGDIVKASQNAGKITYSQTLNELGLKTSRLQTEKAVILTIAANIGDTAILDYPACYPDSLIALTPKSDDLRLEYINIYFKFIKSFLEDLAPQAAQKNINYQQLAPVPIVIPPLAVQDEIIRIYENALLARNSKQKQAQTLLTSINDYLLGELGITLPETDNSLNSRIFTVQMSEVGVGRLDSFTYQPRFTKLAETLEQCRYAVASLAKVATDIKNGVEIRNYVEEGFRYLRVTDLSEHGLNHSSPKFVDVHGVPEKIRLNPNCLLIARSGSLGLVNVVTEDIKDAILSSHIFKVELDTTQIYPEYLEAFARCPIGQEQFKQLNNGGVIPEINQSALKTFKVALPDKSTQQKIIAHIRAIKAQAATLQAEAEQLLSQAKAEIEQMILGGAQ